MILGKSVDKAQIKKISIRVWSLTDEIEATLESLMSKHGGTIPDDDLQLVKSFYEATPLSELSKKPQLTVIQGGKDAPVNTAPAAPVAQVAEAAPTEPSAPAPAPAPAPAAAPAPEVDPFEAAMLAEVEAQKNAQNQAALGGDKAAMDIAKAAVQQLAEVPKQETVQKRPITQEDFLKLRKECIRMHPECQKISDGYALLNDIHFDKIMLFTQKAFKPGQDIVVEFNIHKSFTVIANITNITQISVGSRIITDNPIHFRISAVLKHEHLGDRTLIRSFLKSVDATVTPA